MSNRRELIQAAYDNWNVNQGVDPEVMRDLGYDTPETLPGTLERVLGEEATAEAAQLELVTEAHQPQPDARRAANLRPPRPATTPRQKAQADVGRRHELKPPAEWSPILNRVR